MTWKGSTGVRARRDSDYDEGADSVELLSPLRNSRITRPHARYADFAL